MKLKEIILTVIETGEERIIPAVSPEQVASLRSMAYYTKRKMAGHPGISSIGIQKFKKDKQFFVRIYKMQSNNIVIYTRNEQGELTPVDRSEYDEETKRVVDLMRLDGKSEDEIKEFLKGES